MYQVILPTDFSENAYNAVRYAVQLLEGRPTVFYLLNTYTPVVYDAAYLSGQATMSLTEIAEKKSQEGLDEVLQKTNQEFPNSKHRFEAFSAFNYLTDEVISLAEKIKADLVIMGTQGATGAREVFLGSQTMHVIKHINVPLLAVPANYRYKPVNNILFPNDLDLKFEVNLLRSLKIIATNRKAKVHLLHVLMKDRLSDEQETMKHHIENYFEGLEQEFHLIKTYSITNAIKKYESEQNIDLLAMLNNKHSFFENLFFQPQVENIGFHTQIPFLIIPSGKLRKFSLF